MDQAELQRQIKGVQQRLTTPNIRSDEQIQSLYAKQAALQGQIDKAGKRLGIRRELSGQFARLQTEVVIRLEVLKTTLTEAAKVRLENASAANRMLIVDQATLPEYGEPGMLRLSAACLGLVLVGFLFALVRDYLRQSQTASVESSPVAHPANGTKPRAELKPGEETTEDVLSSRKR